MDVVQICYEGSADVLVKLERNVLQDVLEPVGINSKDRNRVNALRFRIPSGCLHLAQRKNLTTLSALYTIAETILKDKRFSSKILPDTTALDEAYQTIASFWSITLDGVQAYQQYLELTRNNKPVSSLREENLLLKPVTQMALAHVALMAQRKGISWESVVGRLNQVDWSFNNDLWFNILVIGSANKKMITGKESIRSAGMVIAYMVMGNQMTRSEVDDVRQIIRNARNDDNAPLPQMIP